MTSTLAAQVAIKRKPQPLSGSTIIALICIGLLVSIVIILVITLIRMKKRGTDSLVCHFSFLRLIIGLMAKPMIMFTLPEFNNEACRQSQVKVLN